MIRKKIITAFFGILLTAALASGLPKAEAVWPMRYVCAEEVKENSEASDFTVRDGVLEDYTGNAKHVVIPNGVQVLGDSVRMSNKPFYGSSVMESLVIPDSVTTIHNQYFRFCDKMTSLTLSKNLTFIDFSAFEGCRSLESVTLPDGITTIPEYCFSSCDVIRSIVLPNKLENIEAHAFSSDPMLKTMYIPASVEKISPNAFDNTDLTLVVESGSYAEQFAKDQGFNYVIRKKITLHTSVTGNGTAQITNGASVLSNGASVYTGDTIFITARSATDGMRVLVDGTDMLYPSKDGNNILSIENRPAVLMGDGNITVEFVSKASSLDKALNVDGGSLHFTSTNGVVSDVFQGRTTAHFADADGTITLETNYAQKQYISFDLYNRYWGDHVYFMIDDKSYPIPIGSGGSTATNGEFTLNYMLYEIPAGKHTLTWCMDQNTSYYGSIDDPNVHLDEVKFFTNPNEMKVTGLSTRLKVVDLKIQETAALSYEVTPAAASGKKLNWSSADAESVSVDANGTVKGLARGKSIVTASVDGVYQQFPVYVSKYTRDGAYEYDGSVLTWYYEKNSVALTISSRASEIGEYALDGHSELEKVVLPDTVRTIGAYAFRDCSGLTELVIPDSLTEIGTGAFKGCSGLTELVIPDSVTKIGAGAWKGCSGLVRLMVPASVQEIGKNAFPSGDDFILYCEKDSAAYQYAMQNGCRFELPDGTTGQGGKTDAPSVITDSREITQHTDSFNTKEFYLPADPEHTYVQDGKEIYRYQIATNTFDEDPVFTLEDAYAVINVRGAVLYARTSTEGGCKITGYHVLKEQKVYEQEFPMEADGNFAVDDEQNFFFTNSTHKDLFIYDKNGNKTGEEVNSTAKLLSGLGYYYISQVDPYNRVLMTTFSETMGRAVSNEEEYSYSDLGSAIGSAYSTRTYLGYKAYRNGEFISNKNLIRNPEAQGNSIWNFYDRGEYAVNAGGEIVRYKKDPEHTSGIGYDVLYSIPNTNYLQSRVISCKLGSVIYAANSKNKIYAYHVNNEAVAGTYDLSDYTLRALYQVDQQIYVRYSYGGKEYIANLNTKSYKKASEIVRKEHVTLTYTKDQVKQQFMLTQGKKFDLTNSFKTQPSYVSPYKAGELSQEVISQTLTNLNYARWQTGLSKVSLYSDYMERSQKGAVLMAATGELSHLPSRPSDMDEEFYKDGCAGVGADMDYSGNISSGESLPDSIFGYLDDYSNLSGGIGHRLSLLDREADRTSFGFCNWFGDVSMYYAAQPEKLNHNEEFYAWPSAGYFPSDAISSYAAWSLQTEFYSVKSPKVTLKHNNVTYTITDELYYNNSYGTFYFYLPDQLRQALCTKRNREFDDGSVVEVSLSGLLDVDGNSVTVSYPVRFMDLVVQESDEEEKYGTSDNKNGNGNDGLVKDGDLSTDGKSALLDSKKVKIGKIYTDSKTGQKYKILSFKVKNGVVNGGTVAYAAPKNKKVKTASVPKQVKLFKKTFTVTEIANKAFSGCGKLKKVTIGANVTAIGQKAFYKCKKLKTITVKSKKLKKVGRKALSGIHKSAKIKVPKAKLKKYKKLFKNKGQKKTVKVVKG